MTIHRQIISQLRASELYRPTTIDRVLQGSRFTGVRCVRTDVGDLFGVINGTSRWIKSAVRIPFVGSMHDNTIYLGTAPDRKHTTTLQKRHGRKFATNADLGIFPDSESFHSVRLPHQGFVLPDPTDVDLSRHPELQDMFDAFVRESTVGLGGSNPNMILPTFAAEWARAETLGLGFRATEARRIVVEPTEFMMRAYDASGQSVSSLLHDGTQLVAPDSAALLLNRMVLHTANTRLHSQDDAISKALEEYRKWAIPHKPLFGAKNGGYVSWRGQAGVMTLAIGNASLRDESELTVAEQHEMFDQTLGLMCKQSLRRIDALERARLFGKATELGYQTAMLAAQLCVLGQPVFPGDMVYDLLLSSRDNFGALQLSRGADFADAAARALRNTLLNS